jgi:hypothetical protein
MLLRTLFPGPLQGPILRISLAPMRSPTESLAKNIWLFHLALVRGVTAITARVPEGPGVYAWYRAFSPPSLDRGPDAMEEWIRDELAKPHGMPRTGTVPPVYDVSLSPSTRIPRKTSASLATHCQDPAFTHMLHRVFDISIYLQQPLYIGKATDLRARTAQHLSADSELRKRFSAARTQIEACSLLVISLDPEENAPHDVGDEASGCVLPLDEHVETKTQELTLEDVLSRLFRPSFTERYG